MQWTERTRRSLLAVLGAAVTVLGLMSSSALAAGSGAMKVPLYRTFGGCQTGALGGTPSGSFAVINESDHVVSEIALKNALPNTTYSVRFVQTPSGADCSMQDGTITTNNQGSGSAHINEALLPGTTGGFAEAVPQFDPFADPLFTQNVVFS